MQPISAPPIVTLTTDFGLSDHYVGTMKGVILTGCPNARLVDITHDIPAFSVLAGAYAISQAALFYPTGTVHLVVIDPGVGTSRKPLLVEASQQYFIAPDNGVLSLVLAADPRATKRVIENRGLWLEPASNTFHGRDIFAPVAAALASGAATPEQIGRVKDSIETLPDWEPVQVSDSSWRGTVLSVDRFGNAITNFKVADHWSVSMRPFELSTGKSVVMEFRKSFGDAPPEMCFVYCGSSGYLELGVNQGSAAQRLVLQPGAVVTLRFLS